MQCQQLWSFLAGFVDERATQGSGVEVPTTISSELTLEVRVSTPIEEPAQRLPRVEGRPIELLSGSNSTVPIAEHEVA